MDASNSIRIYGLVDDSIVDGPGMRYAVFVQGCTHQCPGCHNPESQPCEGGTVMTVDEIMEKIDANKLTSGITLSGGEPFEQPEACCELARKAKERGLSVWAYSGYLYEQLAAGYPSAAAAELLDCIDVLVDGPFVESLHSYDLKWKGSSNQRVIDMKKTRERKEVVLRTESVAFPQKPPSW